MVRKYKPTLKTEKNGALKIAKELRYPEWVFEKIKESKTSYDVSRALKMGRDSLV